MHRFFLWLCCCRRGQPRAADRGAAEPYVERRERLAPSRKLTWYTGLVTEADGEVATVAYNGPSRFNEKKLDGRGLAPGDVVEFAVSTGEPADASEVQRIVCHSPRKPLKKR